MSKRLLILSDLHCGHIVGLTPPGWQLNKHLDDPRLARISACQREYWNFYRGKLAKYQPFDVVVVNGDAIDGKGERSGGTEAITADRNEQCDMAVHAIRKALGAKTKVVMTYGTPYHTGDGEDFEKNIAAKLDADISGHQYFRVEGVTFDVKHKVGSSQVPHGRHTAIAREHLWSQLWNDHSEIPQADVLIRSHVHYYNGAFGDGWVGMTTPALQGLGSKYGTRQCSGTVDFGFVVFEINKGSYTWEPVLLKVSTKQHLALDI